MRSLQRHHHLAAATLFALLSVLFMSSALFPEPGQVLGGHDMRGYYNILHEAVRDAIHNGRLPLWTPYIFNGYPLIVDPQQSFLYPPAWLTLLVPVNIAISWYMVFHIWLAAMGMYLFVRTMGGRWLPAVLAGVAFAFSGLLAGRLWAGHSTVYALDAWAPWVALALVWSVRRGGLWHGVLAGLPFGLALLAGHLPSFLYVGLIWALLALYLLLSERGRRRVVVRQATLMAGTGIMLAAVQLVPFVQFSLASQRIATADFAFATDYSLPPAHLITLIFPQFFGEPTTLGYWSVPTFEELAYYAGLLPLLVLLLALRRPTRLTWFYILLIILGLALALGRYGVLYPLAFDLLPPFRLVRAPGRAAFLYLFAITALMGHALSYWLEQPVDERRAVLGRLLQWTIAITIISGVAAIAATGAVFAAIHPTDTSGRLWHQLGGYAQALAIFLVACGLVWALLRTEPGRSRRRALLAGALIILVVTDMWLFALKMVRLEPSSPEAFWIDTRTVIGETSERVLPWGANLFGQNGALQVKVHNVFGYSSLEPADLVAFASAVPDPRSSAYDVLGARYVAAPNPLDQFTEGDRGLVLVAQQGGTWVYERPSALPVARLIYDYEVIPDFEAASARVHAAGFDPAQTAVLQVDPQCEVGPAPATPGEVVIEEESPGSWRIRSRSSAPALLVLSETAYPGWSVTIDDEPAPWLTAYTAVRAVCVPTGQHIVEWQFRPWLYVAGALTSLLAWFLVGIAAVMVRRQG